MTSFIAPWSPNFTNDINNAIVTAETVINAVVPGVLPVPPTLVIPTIPSASITPLPLPIPAPLPIPSAPIPSGNVVGAISIEAAVRQAVASIAPQLQADAMAYAQSYLQQVLSGNPTPAVPNVTYNGESLTKTAAKGHAWRTFLIGMGTSAVTAILTAVGAQAHLDFFSKDGWIATGTIAVATLVQTVVSYIGRLQVTPDYERALAAAPPMRLK